MTTVPEDGANGRWTRNAPPERDRDLAPEHVASTVPADYRQINGWGVDLDHANRPMFPMELPSTVRTARGDVKDWQVPEHEIFISPEHPNRTPVFGTSCPPHGLSGALRSYAYKYSEATNRHWMTLILADRIDILGHLFLDPFRGKGDNIIQEKGWIANVKHATPEKRKRVMYMAGAAAIGLAVVALAVSASRDSD
jgi:hypothetical protein